MVSLSSWAKTVKSTWHSTGLLLCTWTPSLFCGNKLLLLHQKSKWFICVQKSLNFGKIPKGISDELYFCTTKKHLQKKTKKQNHDLGGFQSLFWGVLDLKWHLMFEVSSLKHLKHKKTSTNSSCVRCVWVLKFMTIGPRIKSRRSRLGRVRTSGSQMFIEGHDEFVWFFL